MRTFEVFCSPRLKISSNLCGNNSIVNNRLNRPRIGKRIFYFTKQISFEERSISASQSQGELAYVIAEVTHSFMLYEFKLYRAKIDTLTVVSPFL